MPIVGLGMDICSVERIRRIVEGPLGPKFLERVYTAGERALCGARSDAASAYAARFAAKEALVKALGAPKGVRWKDMEIVRGGGAPGFRLEGVAADEVSRRGARVWLTLTHDAGVAAATVVLEAS
jgi:holo-[acyl-carrier protein] synthase